MVRGVSLFFLAYWEKLYRVYKNELEFNMFSIDIGRLGQDGLWPNTYEKHSVVKQNKVDKWEMQLYVVRSHFWPIGLLQYIPKLWQNANICLCVVQVCSEVSVTEQRDALACTCPIFTLLKWDGHAGRWQKAQEKSLPLSELSLAPLVKRPSPQFYPLQGSM